MNQLTFQLNHQIYLWSWSLVCHHYFVVIMVLLHHLHFHLYHYLFRPLSVVDMWSMGPPNRLVSILQFFCTSTVVNWYGFNLLIFTTIRLGSKLISVTSNIILLHNTYCILYGQNHFLVNFPKCDLFHFGSHIIKSLNLNFFLYFSIDSTKPSSTIEFLTSPHITICLLAAFLTLTTYLLKPSPDFLLCGYYQL